MNEERTVAQPGPGPGDQVGPPRPAKDVPQLDDDETRSRRPFLAQIALPGISNPPVRPLYDAQIRSANDRAVFEGRHEGDPDWALYFDLVAEGMQWRKAAYIAWAIIPKERRPGTEQAFAVDELGLTSARRIREWKADEGFINFIRQMARETLASARLDIWRALTEAASDPNPRNHADRKMALQVLGDYQDNIHIGPITEDDIDEVPTEDLKALAYGKQLGE